MEKGKRNEIIREIKSIEGVTIRQSLRIIEISKSVIDRVQGQGTCPHVPPKTLIM